MKCLQQLSPFIWCLAEIDPESDYEITEDKIPLCSDCVDKLLFHDVNEIPTDGRKPKYGKPTRRSAECTFGTVRTRALD